MEKDAATALRILIPVYSDWDSARLLIQKLDEQLGRAGLRASLLFVDDGTPFPAPPLVSRVLSSIDEIRLLTLRRNLGHQRAIAVGLAFLHDHLPSELAVVMDGDGEDDPADVPRLVEKCRSDGGRNIVFARRTKRSEGPFFTAFYMLFRAFYRLLTGADMRVGNFSVVPFETLRRVVVISEIWNHYVGGLLKARLPYTTIDAARVKRLAGRSQMDFIGLITHGLSAIAVNVDVLGVRMLLGTSFLVLAAVVAIVVATFVRLTTNLAIPGWATYVVAFSILTILQAIGLSLLFIIMILAGRNHLDTIPQRDYVYFVLGDSVVYPQ